MFTKLMGQVPTVVIAAATASIFGGGAAYAAARITSADIADQTIQSRDIAAQGVGTSEVRNQSIVSGDIAEGGVGASEIRNGSITGADINDTTEKNLKGAKGAKGDKGDKGDPGADGKDGVVSPAYSASDSSIVQAIGGSFGKFTDGVRATRVDTIELPAGEYVLTAEGFFVNSQATTGKTRMQLAVRVDDGSDWGKDFGTCFTADFGTQKDRETSCNTTRLVQVDNETEVVVYGFGYQRNGQGAATNAVEGSAFVSATPVN